MLEYSAIFIKERFPHLSGWMLGSGFVILYLAALRMHFFSPAPIITDIIPVLVMVYIVSFTNFIRN